MFGGLGIWELLIIFMLVLLIFGARRLPEIGGSLGKGIREFKDSIGGVQDEFDREISGSREGEPPARDEPAGRSSRPTEEPDDPAR